MDFTQGDFESISNDSIYRDVYGTDYDMTMEELLYDPNEAIEEYDDYYNQYVEDDNANQQREAMVNCILHYSSGAPAA